MRAKRLYYKLSHSSQSTKATAEQIWKIWTDVNNWTSWDKGLEKCQLDQEFEVGTKFLLRPKGAPMDLTTELLEVSVNKGFKDRTELPLGTVEVTHTITETEDGIDLSHTIEAHIFEEKKMAFENTLYQKWQKGLPNSVDNIIQMAEEQLGTEPDKKKIKDSIK